MSFLIGALLVFVTLLVLISLIKKLFKIALFLVVLVVVGGAIAYFATQGF